MPKFTAPNQILFKRSHFTLEKKISVDRRSWKWKVTITLHQSKYLVYQKSAEKIQPPTSPIRCTYEHHPKIRVSLSAYMRLLVYMRLYLCISRRRPSQSNRPIPVSGYRTRSIPGSDHQSVLPDVWLQRHLTVRAAVSRWRHRFETLLVGVRQRIHA